jgi:hypothetical protein
MEEIIMNMMDGVVKEMAEKEDYEGLSKILLSMKRSLEEAAYICAKKGDTRSITLFSPWNIRASIYLMIIAVENNNVELCRYLAYTPLRASMMAVFSSRRGNKEIVDAMIEKGADSFDHMASAAIESNSPSILEVALEGGCSDVLWILGMARQTGNPLLIITVLNYQLRASKCSSTK